MLQYETVEASTLELLKQLTQKDYLKQFVLVGGTALALQIGHRKSIDLDFFTVDDFDADFLLAQLKEDFDDIKPIVKLKQTLILDVNQVKVSFIRFHYPFIRPIISHDSIRLLSVEDIAPMKLDALSGRGAKKDFYDLYFLLKDYSLPDLLKLYEEKYNHESIFHVIRSLSYFEDADQDADPIVLSENISWEDVKNKIREAVKGL